ncbi:S-glutathionyl-(chloro)hydroquinone reductase [Spiromyces aspiralis]|uniref:S-glutathionyl-(Chloro)hydroquinone reductase n=1 Tax=Spiromyces aspiralis TaxID=68401 RepID=A0ACC1HNA3_9FUNG|nr:S-glutathionyl-(chloro)hydroquinone reductase [Spiromyces aspiralis]
MSPVKRQAGITSWASTDGEFRRQVSSFRDWVRKDSEKFQPERDRYHLYVSYACPWAHRTLIVRKLKGLDDVIGVSVVHYYLGEDGWKFGTPDDVSGASPDTVNGAAYIRELYFKANANYSGRFTVPVLWDKKHQTIVNNESAEIIRMLNESFDDLIEDPERRKLDLYPEHLRKEIDEVNEWIYDTINNGVYKTGFATAQSVYEDHVKRLFESLGRVERILEKQFLTGNKLTEADIRLWTTILRFDPVYHGHFKCNLGQIAHDFPNILRWARQIYQIPGVKETVNMEHIKKHYYTSHTHINPNQIVPLSNGPDLDNPVIEAKGPIFHKHQ